jgi:hypothetical protein
MSSKLENNTEKFYIPLSWLGKLNFFIIQWFFIRIGKIGNNVNGKFIQTGWTLVKYPYPLTGWWNDYKYLYKKE